MIPLAAMLVSGVLWEGAAPPAARVAFVCGPVERLGADGKAGAPSEGAPLAPGDRLRVGEGGLARAELPGLSLTLAAASALRLEGAALVPVLEQGRLEASSEGETLSVATDEARARGGGRIVVRRTGRQTRFLALLGGFRVTAGGAEVVLASGQGTVVAAGRAPQPPRSLAAPPEVVAPGLDPRYVRAGEAVSLTWAPATAAHVQVLPFESPEAIVAFDADHGAARVSLTVPGLYRWRASLRDADGWEGLPSTEGLIAVVEGP
jgi:hypothetical protein